MQKLQQVGIRETLQHLLCFFETLSRTRLRYIGVQGTRWIIKYIKSILEFAKIVEVLYDAYFSSNQNEIPSGITKDQEFYVWWDSQPI